MFNYNIFFTKNTYYSETFLRYNYKLIVPAATNYFQMTYPHIKKFNKFLINATMFCWVRVAFRGKGFRLRKFKLANKLTFNFQSTVLLGEPKTLKIVGFSSLLETVSCDGKVNLTLDSYILNIKLT